MGNIIRTNGCPTSLGGGVEIKEKKNRSALEGKK